MGACQQHLPGLAVYAYGVAVRNFCKFAEEIIIQRLAYAVEIGRVHAWLVQQGVDVLPCRADAPCKFRLGHSQLVHSHLDQLAHVGQSLNQFNSHSVSRLTVQSCVTANIIRNAVIFDTKVMALENNPEFLKAFGGRVKALRLERGLGLRKMADMMNIENRQLARIENAEINTSILTAYWIAKVLDIPLPELFTFDEAR